MGRPRLSPVEPTVRALVGEFVDRFGPAAGGSGSAWVDEATAVWRDRCDDLGLTCSADGVPVLHDQASLCDALEAALSLDLSAVLAGSLGPGCGCAGTCGHC